VLARAGAGHALRRSADAFEIDVPGPDDQTSWDRLTLERGGVALADELLSYGADVYVESPDALREAMVGRLAAVLDGTAS